MAKKTYLTKADAMSFARFIVSDERRQRLRNECAEKMRNGVKDPTPWTVLVRVVTDEDFKQWREIREQEINNEKAKG